MNEILCGDCYELMKRMPDQSVDLVFTSPPYEDARTYGIGFNFKGKEWADWALVRYLECLRVCKGLVAWVVEGKTRNYRWSATPAMLMANLHWAGVHLRKPPAFHRVGIPGSGGPDWLRNDYEFIVCATNGGRLPWSDNVAMGHTPKWAPGGEMSHRISDGTRRNQLGSKVCGQAERNVDGELVKKVRPSQRIHTKRMANGEMQEQGYNVPVLANPGNVVKTTYTAEEVALLLSQYESGDIVKCNVGGGTMGDKMCHENEAPFPESLAEFFIRSFCPPGGTVLDPFCGSGTTLKMAGQFGRNYIGIDVRQDQVDLSLRRVMQAVISQGVVA